MRAFGIRLPGGKSFTTLNRRLAGKVDIANQSCAVGIRSLGIAPDFTEFEDARCQRECFGQIVRDHEDRHLAILPKLVHQRVDVRFSRRIEGAEGFVKKQDFRSTEKRLGDRKSLLHAAESCAG